MSSAAHGCPIVYAILPPKIDVSMQGCGFDTVGSGSAYSNTSDYVLYFTQARLCWACVLDSGLLA